MIVYFLLEIVFTFHIYYNSCVSSDFCSFQSYSLDIEKEELKLLVAYTDILKIQSSSGLF